MLRDPKTNKLYYGYLSTFLAGLTIFGSTGILNNASAQYIAHLTTVEGWDAALVSNAFSIRTLFSFVMPLVGLAVAKMGPRKCIFFTTVLTSIALVITGYSTGPLMFMVVFGVAVGFSMMFNDALACQAVAANWWSSRRAVASSCLNGMAALGGMVIPPIIAVLLRDYGWTTSLWAAAIALLVITAIPQFIWMKDHPGEAGQEMECGQPKVSKGATAEEIAAAKVEVSWEAKDAMKTPQMWITALCWGFCNVAYAAVMYFSVTHFILEGRMDSVQGSLFITVLNLFLAVWCFLGGGLVKKLGPRWSYFIGGIMCCGCCISITTVTSNKATWILPCVLSGFFGLLQPASVISLTTFYGPKNFAKIQGWLFPIFTILAAATSSLIGVYMAKTGSLTAVFFVCGFVSLGCSVLALFLRKHKKIPAKYQAMYDAQKAEAQAETRAQE